MGDGHTGKEDQAADGLSGMKAELLAELGLGDDETALETLFATIKSIRPDLEGKSLDEVIRETIAKTHEEIRNPKPVQPQRKDSTATPSVTISRLSIPGYDAIRYVIKGKYKVGSLGNIDASAIHSALWESEEAPNDFPSKAVIVDMTELEYRCGDSLGSTFLRAAWMPVGPRYMFILGDKCRDGVTSLLAFLGIDPAWTRESVYASLDEALGHCETI